MRSTTMAMNLGSAIAAGAVAVLMSGCNAVTNGVDATKATSSAALRGTVHGGQQPIVGATIQIYTVGTTGIGSASTPLAGASATTAADGTFGFAAGSYNCSAATQVYILATGGDSGAGVNSSIAAMAPLGSCATLLANASTTFISINELTTVAGVYSLAPFMTDYTHVGAAGANAVGMVNAMKLAGNLVNTSTGSLPGAGLPAGAVIPTAEINTLADIIAACINTSSPSSMQCSTLYSATGATNSMDALLAIAKNPGSPTLTALYTLPGATPPFQPTLSSSIAPNDFSIAIKYNAGGALSTPYGVAIDASGNAWITNASSSAISQLGSAGAVLSSNSVTGLVGAKGIAIDRTGNVWIANTAGDSVVKMTVSGGSVTGANSFLGGTGAAPISIALDSAGNAFVANFNNSTVSELSNAGATVATGLTGGGTIAQPVGIALDASGNVLVANNSNGKVVKLTNAGATSGAAFTDNGLQGASAVTLDGAGNVWLAGATTGSAVLGAVSEFSGTGTPVAASPLSAAVAPLGGATADTTSVWITNRATAGSLLQFQASQSVPVSPALGFGTLSAPVGVAVDPSGNIWTANSGDNTVSQFVGLGKPVTTPIAANVGP